MTFVYALGLSLYCNVVARRAMLNERNMDLERMALNKLLTYDYLLLYFFNASVPLIFYVTRSVEMFGGSNCGVSFQPYLYSLLSTY
jgi:hypothetical protein